MSEDENSGNVLIVDDDSAILTAFDLLLKPHVKSVETERDPRNLEGKLKSKSYDVVFLDMNYAKGVTSGEEGFHWLNRILAIDPSAIVILITAYGDIETAVRAIKEGATDFVVKPWQNEKILATLSSALKLRESRLEIAALRTREKFLSADLDQPFQEIVGRSPTMTRIFETIRKVAGTEANILILGENGTGKELVARAIHRFSKRAGNPFIVVDMGAISETLFESELFGHEKGSFTGAAGDRMGRFEIASGGTLFLDEIANLSLALQAKLLAVVDRREVIRVGSNRSRPINIRLISATNMPIHEMVAQKKFREDLLYRINTVEINLPPLRDRVDDIPLLVDHFVKIHGRKYQKPSIRVSSETMKMLGKYRWPGNIRELQHVIERAVILSDSDSLRPEGIIFKRSEETISSEPTSIRPINGMSLGESPEPYSPASGEESHPTFSPAFAESSLPAAAGSSAEAGREGELKLVEREHIKTIIKKHDGNITAAAKELGLTRVSLYRRMKKYGL